MSGCSGRVASCEPAAALRNATVVLAGSHVDDRLVSMERYTRMLHEGLVARGIKTVLARPSPCLEKLPGLPSCLAKHARYFDKYVIFPMVLRWRLRSAGLVIVHVTDQGNGLYLPLLGDFLSVVTNHDLLAIRAALGEFPGQPRGIGRGWAQRAILQSLRLAKSVVCVSGQSLEDGQRLLSPDRQQFFKVLNAVSPAFFHSHPVPRPADLPESYLLHVGGSSWYKNRRGVLRIHAAMRRQARRSPALVLVGDPLSPAETQLANELGIGETVIVRQRPPDTYVMAAYSGAEALIFPSLAEGFGWPVLEAMAAGCPVFTSNRAPMTEVGGSVAEYVDPKDPGAAAALVLHCLAQGASWRETKAAAGRAWAATFTTDRLIDEMLKVYAITLEQHESQPR